jgi:hypothetical protein
MLASRVHEEILAHAIDAANEFKLRVLSIVEAERLQAVEVAGAPGVPDHQARAAQHRIAWCKRLWNEIAIMPALETQGQERATG